MRVSGVTAAATAMLSLAACSHPAAVVAMPARDAGPAVVLETYLAALKAGDCKTTHALATPRFVPGNGELCGVLTVKAYTIAPDPATPSDHEVEFATSLTTDGGDGTIPEGRNTWFYDLVKQPDGTWRLAGGGTGP